jgi:hypothetical protein
MAGPVPAIDVLLHGRAKDVDARNKPGHDDGVVARAVPSSCEARASRGHLRMTLPIFASA